MTELSQRPFIVVQSKSITILKYMDRTEKELYIKLKDAYYTDDIINRTIEYLKEYNYINDERYAMNYILPEERHTKLIGYKD